MKNLGTFLREVKVELSRVVWPKKEDFFGAIVVVIITMIAFAIFLGLVNYVFQTGALEGFKYLVFGRR